MNWNPAKWGKKLSEMRHSTMAYVHFLRDISTSKMKVDIDDGLDANVVMAPVQWMQRAISEPPYVLERKGKHGEWEQVDEHPILDLLNEPNEFYSGATFLGGLILSFVIEGHGYWAKVKNANNRPKQLWYIPHWLIKPKGSTDGKVFIEYYEYKVGGELIRLERDDVVMFRHGINPKNPRLGLSPIESVIREIWSDRDAGRFTSSLLSNNGIPGMVISPKDGEILSDDVEEVKKYVEEKFGGNGRGKPMVMSGPTEVKQFGFNPQQLDLSSIRNVSEERVCAVLGIPAPVVGFGSGVEATKVGATMKEYVKLAWTQCMIPNLRSFEHTINNQIVSDFGDDLRIRFGLEEVYALQEDDNERATRAKELVGTGIITRAQGKEITGHEIYDGDDIYLVPMNLIEVPANVMKSRKGKKHTMTEERLSESAPRGNQERLAPLAAQIEKSSVAHIQKFQDSLTDFFEKLGAETERVAIEILEPKMGAADDIDASKIAEALSLTDKMAALIALYQVNYISIAEETSKIIGDSIGLATDLPDPVQQAVLQSAGRRAGLIDLKTEVKQTVFEALSKLREEGKGPREIARTLRDLVPAGPWRDSKVRAQVIARTEVKFAQNVSTLERSKVEGIQQVMIFDAQRGSSDATCEALNGRIVSIDEANQLALDEHPNGTRSFSPVPDALLEEILL